VAGGDGVHRGRQGFDLQVEGASIDKQDHAENPCGQIGETVELDRAIQVALDFATHNPDTLIVVTADHAHTSQIIDPPTATDHTPGAMATIITHEGQPMTLNYATNLDGRSQSHTGTEVRRAAPGPHAPNVVGITDQTDRFHTWRAPSAWSDRLIDRQPSGAPDDSRSSREVV
jgi:alkaline phosphatase